jgi:hypothetical protein
LIYSHEKRKFLSIYRSYLKAEGQRMSVAATTGEITSMTAVDPMHGGVFIVQSGLYIISATLMKDASAAKAIVDQLRERLAKR